MHDKKQIQLEDPHFPYESQPRRRGPDQCRNDQSRLGIPETKYDSIHPDNTARRRSVPFARFEALCNNQR